MRRPSPLALAGLVLVLAPLLLAVLVRAGLLDAAVGRGPAARARTALGLLLHGLLIGAALLLVAGLRRRPRHVLVALGTLALGLVVLEVGLRALDPARGWPRMGNLGLMSSRHHHRLPADQTLRFGELDGETLVVTTNEDGLRTPHSRASFRAHERRVAVLGDSFTFGLGVPEGTAFPIPLEAELRRRTKEDVAVLNAALVSYSPYLERLLWNDVVRAYEPELVVAVLDLSDVTDDLKYMEEAGGTAAAERPRFPYPDEAETFRYLGPTWELTSGLRHALRAPWGSLRRALGRPTGPSYAYYTLDVEVGGVRERDMFFVLRHPLEETRPYFERTLANLIALADAVREDGARFCAVVIPRFTHWNPEECPDNWEAQLYSLAEPHQFEMFRFWREAAERVDFELFDLLEAFQATDEFPLVLREDPHWNVDGHAFVARTLANELLVRGLLPPAAADPPPPGGGQ